MTESAAREALSRTKYGNKQDDWPETTGKLSLLPQTLRLRATPPGLTGLAAVRTSTLFNKVFCFISMYLSLDNSFPSTRCGDPRMKEQIKPQRVLGCRNGKTRLYRPSLPHVVTINGFQVLLGNITCLPSYPIGGEKVFSLLFSTSAQYTHLIQSANDPPDCYPTPCTLDIKGD